MTTISESVFSRPFALGNNQSRFDLILHLHDCPNQGAAEGLLRQSTPAEWPTAEKMLKRTIVAAQPLSDILWEGTVTYGDPDAPQNQKRPEPGDVVVSFRFTRATHKLKRSKKTVNYSADGEGQAPNFYGAMNVEGSKGKGRVNGTDVRVPTFELVIRGYFLRSQLTTAYRVNVGRLAHTVNDKPFFGFERGELLFDGAHFDAKSSSPIAEVEFVFAHEQNIVETIELVSRVSEGGGVITRPVQVRKNGWDFLWLYFMPIEADAAGLKFIVNAPVFAYVEQTYDYTDWSGSGEEDAGTAGIAGLGLGAGEAGS